MAALNVAFFTCSSLGLTTVIHKLCKLIVFRLEIIYQYFNGHFLDVLVTLCHVMM